MIGCSGPTRPSKSIAPDDGRANSLEVDVINRPLTILVMTSVASITACWADERGGPEIAAHLLDVESPIVRSVRYEGPTPLTDPSITLVLVPGTDKADAKAFICDVALPYAEAMDPPDHLRIVALEGSNVIATDDSCR